MLTRIKYIQKTHGITNEKLAKETGMSIWAMSKQLNGVYKLNLDVVLTLLRLCPDVSADWLLLGRGEVTRTDTHDILNRIDKLEQTLAQKTKT